MGTTSSSNSVICQSNEAERVYLNETYAHRMCVWVGWMLAYVIIAAIDQL